MFQVDWPESLKHCSGDRGSEESSRRGLDVALAFGRFVP